MPTPDEARRERLATLRRLGRFEEVDELFPGPNVCGCLAPIEGYLRGRGVLVADVGTPWSKNCRQWVYFHRVVLDAAGLIARFAPPASVVVHTHRGTHDGAEHGLVCNVHHDALMGLHPDLAGDAPTVG